MSSRAELHRCPRCGAPRDLTSGVCGFCAANPQLRPAERDAAERAAEARDAWRNARRFARRVERSQRREVLERRRSRIYFALTALPVVAGLGLTTWLTAQAGTLAPTVAVFFGSVSLAMGYAAWSWRSPRPSAGPTRLFDQGCWLCGRLVLRDTALCHRCDLAIVLPFSRASTAGAEPLALGACPHCGGEGALDHDGVGCRHCRAPLSPDELAVVEAEDAMVDEALAFHASRERVRHVLRARRDTAQGLSRLVGWVVAAILCLLALAATIARIR